MEDFSLNIHKSIEELENNIWVNQPAYPGVEQRSYEVRKKPLSALTIQDLKLALTQQIGIEFVVPMALELLRGNPLLDSGKYEGDLLESLLSVPYDFWETHPDLSTKAKKAYEELLQVSSSMRLSWQEFCLPSISKSYEQFSGITNPHKWLRK